MSYLLADTVIASTTPFTVAGIQDPLSDIDWVEFQNESSYSLAVQAGGYVFQIPAWTGWPVNTSYSPGFALPIQVNPKAILNYQATAPGATLSVIIYRTGERPAHTAPYTLARQTNVGNSVPVGTQATQVINTGNSAPTAVLSGTPTGASSPEAVINNDGSATLGGGHVVMNAAGAFTSLPAGAVPVASIGAGALPAGVTVPAAQVNNPSWLPLTGGSVTGPTIVHNSTGNDALYVQDATGAHSASIGMHSDGTGAYLFDDTNGGYILTSATKNGANWTAPLTAPSVTFTAGGDIAGISGLSGSGSATVNHGLGQTPRAVCANTFNGSNSTTFGSGSYTSTTCFIYQFNSQPWVAIAYV